MGPSPSVFLPTSVGRELAPAAVAARLLWRRRARSLSHSEYGAARLRRLRSIAVSRAGAKHNQPACLGLRDTFRCGPAPLVHTGEVGALRMTRLVTCSVASMS